jgi:hypothetical protein
MTKRLLGIDPVTGSTQFVDYDEATDTFRVVDEIEAQPLIDLNRKFYNEAPRRFEPDGAVVARVPMVLWAKLQREGSLYDEKWMARWLNDSDNLGFRTRPGRV